MLLFRFYSRLTLVCLPYYFHVIVVVVTYIELNDSAFRPTSLWESDLAHQSELNNDEKKGSRTKEDIYIYCLPLFGSWGTICNIGGNSCIYFHLIRPYAERCWSLIGPELVLKLLLGLLFSRKPLIEKKQGTKKHIKNYLINFFLPNLKAGIFLNFVFF